MLRKFFLFFIVPIIVLVVITYATIPVWVSLLAPTLSPFGTGLLQDWKIQRIKVGYPSLAQWRIHQLIMHHNNDSYIILDNIDLTYLLQDLWQTQATPQDTAPARNSHITIASAKLNLVNDIDTESTVLMLLYPAHWLAQSTNLSVARFDATLTDITPSLYQIDLSGNLTIDSQAADIVARLILNDDQQTDTGNEFFVEGRWQQNNHVALTFFTEAQDVAIAKLTSQAKSSRSNLLWQGKLALDMAYLPAFISAYLPNYLDTSQVRGKLTNNWRLSIPLQGADSIDAMLAAASGEHELQIQAQTQQPWANTLSVNANLTHTLLAKEPDRWQINGGSQLFTNLNWQHLAVSPATITNLGLDTMELRVIAQSPIQLIADPFTDSFSLQGTINTTLGSDTVGYQLYSQLNNVRYGHTGTWHGEANISGTYAFPTNSPLLQQIPIGIQQVQALAEVEFDFLADRWKFAIAKQSNLSANQVFSQSKQGQLQLFANDRLNLSINEPLSLTYHTVQDQWQWSNLQVSLQPETSTGTENANSQALGLSLNLPAGVSKLSQRINQGSFQLDAKDTQLTGWPRFDLVGTGIFILGNDSLELAFSGDALPLSPEVDVGIDWQWTPQTPSSHNTNNIGTAEVTAKQIPLDKLQVANSSAWPFLLEQGKADYMGQWHWQTQSHNSNAPATDKNASSKHTFTLEKATISHPAYRINNVSGHIDLHQQGKQLTAHYQLQSPSLQLSQQLPNYPILDVAMSFSASNGNDKQSIAKLLQAPAVWQLDTFQGSIFGGTMSLADAQHNQWQIDNLSLNKLSKALYPPIKAQGSLSGQIHLNEARQLSSFQLVTDKQAHIHLTTPLANDLPSAGTLNQLLQNFTSDRITLISGSIAPNLDKIGNDSIGALPVTIQLQGRSPEFNNGEAIELNLQLDTDINQALQQAQ